MHLRMMEAFTTALELTVLLGVAAAAVSIIVHGVRVGITPTPSGRKARQVLLAQVSTAQTGEVHELGAGFGGLARALARRCPGAEVIAWESSWVPFTWAAVVQRVRPLPNLRLHRADFFTAPLAQARLVVCYLFTGAMRRLDPKLRAELPAGAQVLSSTFALHGWTAEATVRADDLYRTPIYCYRLPQAPRVTS
jgi:hypothetical protein